MVKYGITGPVGRIALLAVSLAAATPALAQTACSRQCVLDLQNGVLAALTHGAKAPLAPHAVLRLDAAPMQQWPRLTDLGARQDVVDSYGRGAATFAFARDARGPVLVALRIAVRGRRVSEVEIMTTHRGESGHFPPEGVTDWDPLYNAPLAPAQRVGREGLEGAADGYFRGLDQANGALAPFDRACERYENREKATNRQGDDSNLASCSTAFSSIKPMFDRGVREARHPLVDLERGLVVGFAFHESTPGPDVTYPAGFDLANFGNYPLAVDVAAGRGRFVPRPQALYVADIFKVVNGRIRQVEVLMKYLPYRTRTGFR
jgi:hypothetical protein